MNDVQISTSGSVDFEKTTTLSWDWTGDSTKVPQGMALVISTLTFNYFPSGPGTIGRVGINRTRLGRGVRLAARNPLR